MPDNPYKLTGNTAQELQRQMQMQMDEMYQDRIGGALLGDVFAIPEDETLTLTVGDTLSKTDNTLDVALNATGGLQSTATGISVKPKSGGGLATDSSGLYIAGTAYGFGTVTPSSGTSCVADTLNDTLTITGSNGITVTGTASTDTIDIKPGGSMTIGVGGAGVDYSLTFDGESNDGVMTWMEDEDYFQFADDINLGGATNYVKISDTDGNMTWGGTYKKKLTMRPSLNAGKIAGAGKPTAVAIGAHSGYSLPVYNNDNEELFFRDYVPGRWDGASDITVSAICCLAAAEDVGDKFKLQLSWANKETASGAISASTTDVTAEQAVATGRSAQYSIYKLEFTIDWDLPATDVAASDHLAFRLYRIASASPAISDEVIILDVIVTYTVDKVFKTV